jgi:predicted amidohydrolase
MQVTLVQAASTLDPAENRERLAELTPEGSDLVVFPEAFARDFGEPGADLSGAAEDVDGPFAEAVERVAKERGTTVLAGMFERGQDPARPVNTLVLRGEARAEYRKIHLYDSFGYRESDSVTAGPLETTTVDLAGLRLGLMTCYDLRFPELARALAADGADVLVLPAAWVAGPRKVDHWTTLARARAIENTAYVVGVGQPGPRYTGHSIVVDPLGEVLAEAGDGPETLTVTLDPDVVAEARRTNPSLANRRL